MRLYGFLTTTILALEHFRAGTRKRIIFIVGAAVVGALVAVLGQGNFLDNYANFLLFLEYLTIPWTAINLVDFYLVRQERYNIAAIFDPDGVYGAVNWRALMAYVVAVLLELSFISMTLYTGPLVARLGGADISWSAGLVIAALLYYILMRTRAVPAGASAGEVAGGE